MNKQFSLAQILTITDGRLLCDIGGVYEILDFITGDSLFTHSLPRASRFAQPQIAAQLPWIANIQTDLDELTTILKPLRRGSKWDAIAEWNERMACKWGANHPVESCEDSWLSMNPIAELAGMVGQEKIIEITPEQTR